MHGLLKNAGSLPRDDRGNVAIELALVMSVLMILTLAGYDMSRMAAESHRLEQVARSAAHWGLATSPGSLTEDGIEEKGIEAAVAAGFDPGDPQAPVTVAAVISCECPGEGGVGCGDTCADDSEPEMFVSVEVTKPFVFTFNLAAFGLELGEFTLRGSTVFRVE